MGGGIAVAGGQLMLIENTIAGNQAIGGDGVSVEGGLAGNALGGAIAVTGGAGTDSVTIDGNTISGNRALGGASAAAGNITGGNGVGGGLFVRGSDAPLSVLLRDNALVGNIAGGGQRRRRRIWRRVSGRRHICREPEFGHVRPGPRPLALAGMDSVADSA